LLAASAAAAADAAETAVAPPPALLDSSLPDAAAAHALTHRRHFENSSAIWEVEGRKDWSGRAARATQRA
jgi:hypothetical protein